MTRPHTATGLRCKKCDEHRRVLKSSGLCVTCNHELSQPTPDEIAAIEHQIRAENEASGKRHDDYDRSENRPYQPRIYKLR